MPFNDVIETINTTLALYNNQLIELNTLSVEFINEEKIEDEEEKNSTRVSIQILCGQVEENLQSLIIARKALQRIYENNEGGLSLEQKSLAYQVFSTATPNTDRLYYLIMQIAAHMNQADFQASLVDIVKPMGIKLRELEQAHAEVCTTTAELQRFIPENTPEAQTYLLTKGKELKTQLDVIYRAALSLSSHNPITDALINLPNIAAVTDTNNPSVAHSTIASLLRYYFHFVDNPELGSLYNSIYLLVNMPSIDPIRERIRAEDETIDLIRNSILDRITATFASTSATPATTNIAPSVPTAAATPRGFRLGSVSEAAHTTHFRPSNASSSPAASSPPTAEAGLPKPPCSIQ